MITPPREVFQNEYFTGLPEQITEPTMIETLDEAVALGLKAIFIKNGNLLERLDINDINWIQSDGNYSIIQATNKKFVIKKSLIKIMDLLPSCSFIRAHMKYIVAMDKVDRIDLRKNKLIIDGVEVALGRKYRSILLERLTIFK